MIADYHNGQIRLDQGFGLESCKDDMSARLLRWSLSHHPESHKERLKQLYDAIQAYRKDHETQ